MIKEIPSRLLLYFWFDRRGNFDLRKSKEGNLAELHEVIAGNYLHPFFVTHAKSACEYIERLTDATYRAFTTALERLDEVGLMYNGEVSPVALDAFPSLVARKQEIEKLHRLMIREREPIKTL